MSELEGLKREIREQMDSDAYGQVIRYFKSIADSERRKQVLAELQAMDDNGL